MTKRELKYLIIIYYQGRLISRVLRETNAHIAMIEQQANIELERLTAAQIKADQGKIDTVLESADTLWQELQQAEANVVRLQSKLKFKKRAMRET